MAADPGADRSGHGERGGEQRAEPEEAEHLPEQPVVAAPRPVPAASW